MTRILDLQKMVIARQTTEAGFDSTCSYLNCDACSTYSQTNCTKPVKETVAG